MSDEKIRREALIYHAKPQPGKIKIVPTKPYATQRDLALAYSPGVAEPCLEIAKDKENAYKYTSKLIHEDVDKFVETVKMIAPTFGGINLEDIKAPEAFEIERRLKAELDIPVMHDDQHGTAIISAAALLNALELTGKKMESVKIVVSGAGAAAVSCTRLYKAFGAKDENIVMLDSKGVIRKDRGNLSKEKLEFASDRKIDTLDEAMKDADVFIGLSIKDIVSPEMLLSMAKDPIVFAMANPDPEIKYDLAIKTRKDIIMATGRSDHPNQVNNVLAELTREPVPEQVNIAYGETRLTFGRDYIIPKPFDPRLISEIPPAIAKAAMESGVAKQPINDWEAYKEELRQRSGDDNKVVRLLHTRAKMSLKKIVFAEADHLDVLKAAQIFDADIEIIDPSAAESEKKRSHYATKYWENRRRSGSNLYNAKSKMRERNYFGSMMVLEGDADGMISGYSRAYPRVVKPVFEVIGRATNVTKAATVHIMITKRGPLFLADTSINIDPTAEELAEIARNTATVASTFGFKPVMALLSYANYGSSSHPNARKIKEAVRILHDKNPELILLKELNGADSIGPIMVGLRKSVHILQLGASVDEIVNMTAVAAIDAQEQMIHHLTGKLVEKNPTNVIIECGGVGYFVNISLHTFSKLTTDENISLFTHLQVLVQARTMLSSLSPSQIRDAIAGGDSGTIQGIKGIGAKTAQRVILDLRDKVLKVYDLDEVSLSSNNTNKDEALSALEVLGFPRRQAEKAVDKLRKLPMGKKQMKGKRMSKSLVREEGMKDYFKEKSDAFSGKKEGSEAGKKNLLPIFYKDNKFFKSIFGEGGIEVIPQGSVAMDLGVIWQKNDNPSLSPRNRTNLSFDFDQRISLSLLDYNPSEDDILQNIEAGNVSMPLNSSLIQGAQSLFGVKADLQVW
ncbi:NADP-dependent malic enzyme [Nymphon striatum]|nr:NADP-dependent malic enzyme [Nymphon striatum]